MPQVDRPIIAVNFPANSNAVGEMLRMSPGDDTRSEWRWYRLANGDLMLGFAPHADGYCSMEEHVEADYDAAVNADELSYHWAEEMGVCRVGPGKKPELLPGKIMYGTYEDEV